MNLPTFKSQLLGAAVATATMIGAGAVSAATVGSIPGGGINNGLQPIFGVDSVDGFFGANIGLTGAASADVTVDFLGFEAGRINAFEYEGVELFATDGTTDKTWDTTGTGSTVVSAFAGLLDFIFTTSNAAGLIGIAANGANPDGSVVDAMNFFVTFDTTGTTQSGSVAYLFYDDMGAGPDDNHDDMVIRLTVSEGELSIVPIPASVPLLLTALGGLGLVARRKRS